MVVGRSLPPEGNDDKAGSVDEHGGTSPLWVDTHKGQVPCLLRTSIL